MTFSFSQHREPMILHIVHFKHRLWQWQRILMVCLRLPIIRKMVTFHFWREKAINMTKRLVTSTLITDYDFLEYKVIRERRER